MKERDTDEILQFDEAEVRKRFFPEGQHFREKCSDLKVVIQTRQRKLRQPINKKNPA